MSHVERVNAAWERIEKWYAEKNTEFKLPVGATAADITAVETHIGVALPEELKASLMRHNGVECWTKWELLSTERLQKEWSVWAKLKDDGTFDNRLLSKSNKKNRYIQQCWYDKLWIPIDADGAGNSACLDLNPGPKGKVGQIIDMDHESRRNDILFPNFAAYLEKAAEELEAGKYRAGEEGMLEEVEEGEDESWEDLEEGEEDEGDEGEENGKNEDNDEEGHEAVVLSLKSKRFRK